MARLQYLIPTLLLPSLLCGGCAFNRALFLHRDNGLEVVPHKPFPNPVYERNSFVELSMAVNRHIPPAATQISHSGELKLSSRKYLQTFHFEFDRDSENDWSLNLYRDRALIAVLQKRWSGLTYQNIPEQTYFQKDERLFWSEFETGSWPAHLKQVVEALTPPRIDPKLPWVVEEDGIKRLLIVHVSGGTDGNVKNQFYIDKRKKVVSRVVRNTFYEHFVEDWRYGSFRDVSGYLLASEINVQFPRTRERIELEISDSTLFRPVAGPGGLKPL